MPVIDEESVSAFARDFASDSVVGELFHVAIIDQSPIRCRGTG